MDESQISFGVGVSQKRRNSACSLSPVVCADFQVDVSCFSLKEAYKGHIKFLS